MNNIFHDAFVDELEKLAKSEDKNKSHKTSKRSKTLRSAGLGGLVGGAVINSQGYATPSKGARRRQMSRIGKDVPNLTKKRSKALMGRLKRVRAIPTKKAKRWRQAGIAVGALGAGSYLAGNLKRKTSK